jgi:hypothetical protein
MKKTEIVERLDAMQEEIDSLRAYIDEQAAAPSITYVREVFPPKPISAPLDVLEVAREVFSAYSYYTEEGDIYGPNKYL